MANHELANHWFNRENVDVGDFVWVRVDNGIMRWKRRVQVVGLELNKFGYPMATVEYEGGKQRTMGVSYLYKHEALNLPNYEPAPPKEVMQAAWEAGR